MLTIASIADALLAAPVIGWAVGWQEILVIVIVVLILFGGRKIPELARGLGRGLREFKREMGGIKRDFEEAATEAEAEEDYDVPRRKKRRKKAPREAEELGKGDEVREVEFPGEEQAPAESGTESDSKQG